MQTDTNAKEQEQEQESSKEVAAATVSDDEAEAQAIEADDETGRPSRRGSPVMLALTVLALLTAAGGIGAGYYVWQESMAAHQELESRLGQAGSRLQETRSRVQALGNGLDDMESRLRTDLQGRLDGLRGDLSDLRDTVSQVRSAQRQGPAPVVAPARVEHLLLIANDTLILERDVETALAALRAADRRLRELDDPLFAETRRLLAEEITTLESLPRPDVTGMAFTLSGLQDGLPSLPLRRRQRAELGEAQMGAAEGGQEISGWRGFLRDIWEAIKSLVVVRRAESEDIPLLRPDQRMFLEQNLYLKLEAGRLALLERDPKNFKASLETARAWLTRYYDTDAPAVAAMIKRLKDLGELDIAPEMPDISPSLGALRAALERRRSQSGPAEGASGQS